MVLAALAALVVACGSKDPSPPSGGTYTIAFPSTAAAVSSENVKVLVFEVGDAGAAADICTNLVILRRSNQQLPQALAESKLVPVCDLAAGKGQVTVPFGTRAVLAIAQKGGSDYLIGCAVQNVGEGSSQVPVQLALATTTVTVPATTCATLSDHCANRCPN